jgi:uncharacterized protein with ATP-grasp and redox domains
MKIQPECVPCLLKRIVFETIQSTNDDYLRFKTIKNACTLLAKLYDKDECSATIATKVHKNAYEILGDNDPYKKLKEKSNKVAKSLVPHIEELIDSSDDPLRITIICSIVGNIMDFGIEGVSNDPENLSEKFDEFFVEDLFYDDTDELKKILMKSKKVLLFTDNSGEIVFDKILCREIKKFNNKIFLTLVVKGEPIISDATLKDVEELNFKEVSDEILTTGSFAIGLDFNKITKKLKKAIEESDLIICKGMANYEAFSETNYKPIAYLLRTKCTAISNSIGVPINKNVVKLYD